MTTYPSDRARLSRRHLLIGGAAAAATGLVGRQPTRASARGTRTQWKATWATALMGPIAADAEAHAGFRRQTLRQVIKVSSGGPRIRLQLAHPFGGDSIVVGPVTVARRAEGVAGASAEIDLNSVVEVTFDGSSRTEVSNAEPVRSDVIDFPLDAGGELVVSFYLAGPTGPVSFHRRQHATGYVAAGNRVGSPAEPYITTNDAAYLLQAIQVQSDDTLGVAVLGDSITEGIGTPLDANQRLTDQIARNLNVDGSAVAVANLGISGNKLLHDHPRFGQSGLHRFDRDVLGLPNVDTVILGLGINDLLPPPNMPTPRQLLTGYRQLAQRGHARGLRVVAATITPFKGLPKFSPELEQVRQRVNRGLRNRGFIDAVADFDKVLRDLDDPARMRADLHNGDWLHPNALGTRVMATAVPLEVIAGSRQVRTEEAA